ncbi:antibiotic biosynthesis monooxygenase [Pseudomonas sp. SK3(2021)]|uniref:putative quinol monooxygenase n=1 Tax=Pseudomonas sp. SK3(2021) TaxID=2841064 RepID=UPI00192B26FF|nr:putative quinol monooxygenase [Pseudomonas sp. SK3(2021)]QQZ44572.1 antibiotic biosynthesis monooxygenase [Pseudomonas sp. SK3(2021)]
MSSTATNSVQIRAVQGRSDELGEHLDQLLAALREAPGCLGYELRRDSIDTHRWTVRGQWRSAAEMQAHFQLPAAQGFIDLLASRLACALDFEH